MPSGVRRTPGVGRCGWREPSCMRWKTRAPCTSVAECGGVGNEPAMAAPPQGFRTHDGSRHASRLAQQISQGFAERRIFHVVGIRSERGVPQGDVGTIRPAFAKAPQGGFPSVCAGGFLGHPMFHALTPDIGQAPASGNRANVDQKPDARTADEGGQFVLGCRAVSERQEGDGRGRPGRCLHVPGVSDHRVNDAAGTDALSCAAGAGAVRLGCEPFAPM
jgi:hypothetical protein